MKDIKDKDKQQQNQIPLKDRSGNLQKPQVPFDKATQKPLKEDWFKDKDKRK